MTDIVAKLKSPATIFYEYAADKGELLREAADTIEALRAENAKLRDALKPFADIAKELDADSLRYCDIDITVAVADLRAARAAMGEGDDRL